MAARQVLAGDLQSAYKLPCQIWRGLRLETTRRARRKCSAGGHLAVSLFPKIPPSPPSIRMRLETPRTSLHYPTPTRAPVSAVRLDPSSSRLLMLSFPLSAATRLAFRLLIIFGILILGRLNFQGTFTFIDDPAAIPPAFACCLGGYGVWRKKGQ